MVDRPLRVAMLSVHTCPLAILGGKKTGGMNVYVRDLSIELGRRGIQVDIFTRSQDPCVPHVNDNALGSGINVIHMPCGPESPLPTSELFQHLPEFVSGVAAFAEQDGVSYDILHSHYWLSGWAALRLRELWDTPIVQMFHTLGRMKDRITQETDDREAPVRVEVEHEVMRRADCLIAATPAERTQMMWLYNAAREMIHVVPPGVDLERFHPIPPTEARQMIGIPPHHRMLLFVGRIERLKGIDTLMQAMEILKRQAPQGLEDLCLTIIGGEPREDPTQEDAEMQRLRQLRSDLGVEELVTFLGARGQNTLQYYYSAAEAVIMPSHYESFGMVALEAMACGTPVIASEVGGLAYLVQDGVTGFHVPDREPEELAGKIRLLLENRALRTEMSQAAVKHAQAYRWPRIADQIEAVYSDCLAARRSKNEAVTALTPHN